MGNRTKPEFPINPKPEPEMSGYENVGLVGRNVNAKFHDDRDSTDHARDRYVGEEEGRRRRRRRRRRRGGEVIP